jgi:hypothetical protein
MFTKQQLIKYWSKVDWKNKSVNDCWNWIGNYVNECGVGQIKINNVRYSANRVAYIHYFGQLSDNIMLIQSCENKKCCNPYHMIKNDFEYRFWSKIYIPEDYNIKECWLWLSGTDKDGYGEFRLDNITFKAHRIMYEIIKGPIDDDMEICHSCNNTSCVNPYHMRQGTSQDNANDRIISKTVPMGSSHINSTLTEENIFQIFDDIDCDKFKSFDDLCINYNITRTVVLNILNRKSWNHVTNDFPQLYLDFLKSKITNIIMKCEQDEIIRLYNIGFSTYRISKLLDINDVILRHVRERK